MRSTKIYWPDIRETGQSAGELTNASSHYCPVVGNEEGRNALLVNGLQRNPGVFDLGFREVKWYPFEEQKTRKESDEYRADDIFPNHGSHADA